MKKIGLMAVAVVAALVLGSTMFGGSAPTAKAETTGALNIHCLLLISIPYTNATFDACTDLWTPAEVADLADQIGDEDDELEVSDFDAFADYDADQLSETCTTGAFCSNLIFTFVDDEKPVTLDTPSGLTSIQAAFAETDFICDDTTEDNDCDDTPASDGDGVVVFNVVNFNDERGDEEVVRVSQEAVEQTVDVNVVGTPNDVTIVLAEDTIGTNGSNSEAQDCADNVDVEEAVEEPNATVAVVTVYDEDDRELAMIGGSISVDPPSEEDLLAVFGESEGGDDDDIDGNTSLTINPGDGLPIAYYQVICGGRSTGETVIKVQIDDGDADFDTDDDTDTADLTVVGVPFDQTLSAAAAVIKCDGTETSTVTAHVVDEAGNNVADGTEVTFTVVALGTANPINTTTTDGIATTIVTPLSNSSAGVTVIVTSGEVQESIRVDCAIPLAAQATVVAAIVGAIAPPDTGSGGYAAEDSSGLSLMTLVALALAGAVVVAGGVVARRAAK